MWCARWARISKRTEVRGLGAPVPLRLGSSKKEMAMTRPIEAQPRGDFSPLSCPCPYGAHRFLSIITQGFNPGSEDKLYDQTYRGSASRGLQSPFLPVPLRGTPLLPNNSPGLQSWVVLRAGRKSSKRTKSVTRSSKKLSSMTRGPGLKPWVIINADFVRPVGADK